MKIQKYNDSIKYSVIVTNYNCEKFIDNCLDSVLKQTYKNFELIVIDDGSSDLSKQIILKHAKKDSRVKYVFQKNEGCFNARLNGINQANGEYLLFLDSDDLFDTKLLNEIEKIRSKYAYDMFIFDLSSFGGGSTKKVSLPFNEGSIEGQKYEELLDILSGTQLINNLACKAIKSEIAKKILNENLVNVFNGDDIVQSTFFFFNSDSYYYLPKTLYLYRSLQNSKSRNLKKSFFSDLLYIRSFIKFNLENSNNYSIKRKKKLLRLSLNSFCNGLYLFNIKKENININKSIYLDVKLDPFYNEIIRGAIFQLFRNPRICFYFLFKLKLFRLLHYLAYITFKFNSLLRTSHANG